MGKLAALCCLWAFGLGGKEEYSAELDRLFLESPEDDFLLELECLGSDRAAAWERLSPLLCGELNVDEFGRELFARLERLYSQNGDLAEFGRLCHALWNSLPSSIDTEDPFYALSYADDPLSWGDEKQTRELYQKAFDHYK